MTGWLGSRTTVPRRGAVTVVVVNLGWVADSVVLPLTDWVDPNGLGVAFVLVQAVAVLAITELRYTGLRRHGT